MIAACVRKMKTVSVNELWRWLVKLIDRLSNFMMAVGECYVGDLRFVARQWSSDNNARRVVKQMMDEGLLTLRETNASRTEVMRSVSLSKQGRIRALDRLSDPYWHEYADRAEASFHVSDAEQLARKLADSRIRIMMKLAGAAVFPAEKPSLAHLVNTMNGNAMPSENAMEYYREEWDADRCAELLNSGVYYTIEEYRAFLESIGQGESDVTYLSRARGIFISSMTCLIVYIGKIGDNKLIAIRPAGEQRLIDTLVPILRITHVTRSLPGMAVTTVNEYTGAIRTVGAVNGAPYALIISDGDSLAYSTATGNPRGKITGRDAANAAYADRRAETATMQGGWLKGSTKLFRRVFVTSFTASGVGALGYLTSCSFERWMEGTRELLDGKTDEGFIPNSSGRLYQFHLIDGDRKVPVLYMPVFEACELFRLAKDKKPVVIVTYPDMYDAVARSLREDVIFYNADTMERVPADQVMVYDTYGYPAGLHAVEKYIESKGEAYDDKAYAELPEKMGFDSDIKLSNAINDGTVKVEDVEAILAGRNEAKPAAPKKRAYVRRSGVSIVMSAAAKKTLEKAAKYHGLSVSNYVKGILAEPMKKDAEAYDAQLKANRDAWKAKK